MPLKGIICGYDGQYRTFDECICSHENGTRSCHAPVQLLKIMRDNHIERKDAGISASTLTNCARATALQETYDIYESTEVGYNKARGTWVHSMMESDTTPRPGLIRERRIKRVWTIDGEEVIITGKPDEVDTERLTLIDYKSKDRIPKYADPKHEAQFNVYIGLLRDGEFMDTGEKIAIEIRGGGMHYLTWNPKGPFMKMSYPVWDEYKLQDFIAERVRPLISWKKTGELPACNAYITYGKNWECDCIKLERQIRETGQITS